MAGRDNPFFSWSPSREEMFHECELCYLFHYYTAHKGWYNKGSSESKSTYRWKKAVKVEELMMRELTEGLIEGIYSDEKLSVANIQKEVLAKINQSFIESTTKKEQWYRQPNKVNMLYELVYEEKLDDDLVENTKKQLNQNLNNLMETKLVKELSKEGSRLLQVRQSFRQGFSYFDYEAYGIRVYAGVQVVHRRADGKVVATLFKTKDKPSTLSQVGAVAKVVADVLDEDINNIIVRDENLFNSTSTEHAMTDSFFKQTIQVIEDSIQMMRRFLVDEDFSKNEFIGFQNANYKRSFGHQKAGKDNCTMDECPYCEAVKRDLELYPNGYDSSVAIMKYSKEVLKNLQTA